MAKKFKSIRWSLSQAGTEFNLSASTVSKRVKAAGILPGEDGKFSTVDIHKAICDQEEHRKEYEKLRAGLIAAKTERARIESDIMTGKLVDTKAFHAHSRELHIELREVILKSSLSEADQDSILALLAEIYQREKTPEQIAERTAELEKKGNPIEYFRGPIPTPETDRTKAQRIRWVENGRGFEHIDEKGNMIRPPNYTGPDKEAKA